MSNSAIREQITRTDEELQALRETHAPIEKHLLELEIEKKALQLRLFHRAMTLHDLYGNKPESVRFAYMIRRMDERKSLLEEQLAAGGRSAEERTEQILSYQAMMEEFRSNSLI